jgi:hypothetical protein
MTNLHVPSSRRSQTSSLFCACDVSMFFTGDVREDELLVMTLTLFWAPRSFILSFVGERAPACRNLKAVSRIELQLTLICSNYYDTAINLIGKIC